MKNRQKQESQSIKSLTSDTTLSPLVMPFHEIDASMLAQVGGKAANLGELTRAGFPVPPGFCITTQAYTSATSGAELESVLVQLANTPADDVAHLETYAAAARSKLLAVSIPTDVIEAMTQAYHELAPD